MTKHIQTPQGKSKVNTYISTPVYKAGRKLTIDLETSWSQFLEEAIKLMCQKYGQEIEE